MKPEEHLEAVKSEITASEARVAQLLKERDAEIKSQGEASAKTAKALDDQVKLWTDKERVFDEMKAELEAAGKKIADLEEHAKASQRPGYGGEVPNELKSVGQRYIESDICKRTVELKAHQAPGFEAGDLLGSECTRTPLGSASAMEQKASFLSTAATRLVEPFRREFVGPQLRVLRIRDMIPVYPTTSNAIEYIKETGFAATGAASGTQTHGAADFIAEDGASPEAQLEMQLLTEGVKDVSHWLPASQNILEDLPRIRSYIDGRLLYGLGYHEDLQLLYGTGVGANLQGITTETGIQTYLWSDGETLPVPDTKFDAVRRSMTKAHIEEYMPTFAVINPTDWEDIELTKGTDGHYLLMPISVAGPNGIAERIWRLDVVVTNAITAATWLVGSAMACELYDRQQGTITVSDSHEDFFTTGLVAVKAKQREALVILRPPAFVLGTFDAAPA